MIATVFFIGRMRRAARFGLADERNVMFSTYEGAKKFAKRLNRKLTDYYISLPLNRCQTATAIACGFQSWHELRNTGIDSGLSVASERFAIRLTDALPEPCRRPTNYWLSDEKFEWLSDDEMNPAFGFWCEFVVSYLMGMYAVHRKHTALVRIGSGQGQRLRESLLGYALMNGVDTENLPMLDAATLALKFPGHLYNFVNSDDLNHKKFDREFARLIDAGIFSWEADENGRGILTVFPPSPTILIDHLKRSREMKAEDDRRMEALFNEEHPEIRAQ